MATEVISRFSSQMESTSIDSSCALEVDQDVLLSLTETAMFHVEARRNQQRLWSPTARKMRGREELHVCLVTARREDFALATDHPSLLSETHLAR